MRVLNESDIGEWTCEIKCECGAHLEAVATDFYRKSDKNNRLFVTCPRCRGQILFSEKDLPPIAMIEANKKEDNTSYGW